MKKKKGSLNIRAIKAEDCTTISSAFSKQGWNKPESQYQEYLTLQKEGFRDILIAEYDNEFAGYLTICWESSYVLFKEKSIPEIVDFNVLKKFQRQGIGTALMDEAEKRMKKRSPYAGLGFGVTKDYGAAQILYINRSYKPDGQGLSIGSKSLEYGDQIMINDDVVFHLIKKL